MEFTLNFLLFFFFSLETSFWSWFCRMGHTILILNSFALDNTINFDELFRFARFTLTHLICIFYCFLLEWNYVLLFYFLVAICFAISFILIRCVSNNEEKSEKKNISFSLCCSKHELMWDVVVVVVFVDVVVVDIHTTTPHTDLFFSIFLLFSYCHLSHTFRQYYLNARMKWEVRDWDNHIWWNDACVCVCVFVSDYSISNTKFLCKHLGIVSKMAYSQCTWCPMHLTQLNGWLACIRVSTFGLCFLWNWSIINECTLVEDLQKSHRIIAQTSVKSTQIWQKENQKQSFEHRRIILAICTSRRWQYLMFELNCWHLISTCYRWLLSSVELSFRILQNTKWKHQKENFQVFSMGV